MSLLHECLLCLSEVLELELAFPSTVPALLEVPFLEVLASQASSAAEEACCFQDDIDQDVVDPSLAAEETALADVVEGIVQTEEEAFSDETAADQPWVD